MKNINKVLKQLEENDMQVKELLREDEAAVSRAANQPIMPIIDKYYIMQGDKVVHVGNLKTIESFALRL